MERLYSRIVEYRHVYLYSIIVSKVVDHPAGGKRLSFFREWGEILLRMPINYQDGNDLIKILFRFHYLWISSCFRFLRMRTVEMKFISQRSTSGIVCSYSPSNSWPARDRGGGRCIPHSPNSSAQWAVSWIRNDTPLLPARKKNRDFRSALERSLAAVRLRRREREINKRGGKKTVEEIHPSEDRQDSLR